MKQSKCRHNSGFAHSVLLKSGEHATCPGPLELKVEATTTKEGDIDRVQGSEETK